MVEFKSTFNWYAVSDLPEPSSVHKIWRHLAVTVGEWATAAKENEIRAQAEQLFKAAKAKDDATVNLGIDRMVDGRI